MDSVKKQISNYITLLSQDKQKDVELLYQMALLLAPNCKLWFLDGKDAKGKVVSNPNIGFGSCILKSAKGAAREFYKLGLSANTSGISIYVFDLPSKTYLQERYASRLGKASISGYCIKCKRLSDVHHEVVEELFKHFLQA